VSDDWEWCRAFIDHHCIYRSPPGEYVITSADHGTNAWQFYLPIAVLDNEFAERVSEMFWLRYAPVDIQLCGCEGGGSLLVSVLQAEAKRRGYHVPAFMIKKAAKSYGLGNWLEGMRLNSRRRPTPIANNDAPSSMDQKSRIHLSLRASRCAYTGPQKFGMYRSHMVAIVERHSKSGSGGGGAPAAQRTKFCTRRSS
jgi:hypothetical protein